MTATKVQYAKPFQDYAAGWCVYARSQDGRWEHLDGPYPHRTDADRSARAVEAL